MLGARLAQAFDRFLIYDRFDGFRTGIGVIFEANERFCRWLTEEQIPSWSAD